jgi:hypothetical protein
VTIQQPASSLQAILAGPRGTDRRRAPLDDVRGGDAPPRLPPMVRRILASSLSEAEKRAALAQYRAQQDAGPSTLDPRQHPAASCPAQASRVKGQGSSFAAVAAAIGADPRRRMFAWVLAHWPQLAAGTPAAAQAAPHHVEQATRTLYVAVETAPARYLVQPHLAALTARLRQATAGKLQTIRLVAGGDTVRRLLPSVPSVPSVPSAP